MTATILPKSEATTVDDNENETYNKENHESEKEFSYQDHMNELYNEIKNYTYKTIFRKHKHTKESDLSYKKARKLLPYDEAPHFLKHNSYIRHGYRGILKTEHCIESVLWWTNESINIWSHFFGFLLFVGLTINDLLILRIEASFADKFIVASVLVCFQICMTLSSVYHTFNCRSEKDCDIFLSFDLFGIALSLLAIYTSGIYYAFWCNTDLQNFYLSTVTFIFVLAMILQIPQLNVDQYVQMFVFVGWAAYGVVPTFHWTVTMGGFENPLVALLLPRVLGMYLLTGIAFLIYITRIPGRS